MNIASFIDILKSANANKFLFSLGCVAIAAICKQTNPWLLVLIFCMAWLFASVLTYLVQIISSNIKHNRYEQHCLLKQKEEQDKVDLVAKDLYLSLSLREKQLLQYAVLAGIKTSAYDNVWFYDVSKDPFVPTLAQIDDLQPVVSDGRLDVASWTQYINNYDGRISFLMNSSLAKCVEEDIEQHKITKDAVENSLHFVKSIL